jgi:exonuclease III
MHLSGSITQNASNGIACYIKSKYKNNVRIMHNADENYLYHNTKEVEMCVVQVKITGKTVYLVGIYYHPGNSIENFTTSFIEQMKKFSPGIHENKNKHIIIILGDFNIDAYKKEKDRLYIQNSFNFNFLDPGGHTTNRKTTIDWVLTNVTAIDHKMIAYESVFSDHKPLWLFLKQY